MTVVAVSMVKDEADIIAHTVTHLLDEVDYVVVADNLSTDGSRQLLEDLSSTDRVLVLNDDEPGYYQSQKMTHLANLAHREFGADWIVPFDADEWWYSPFGKLSEVLEDIAPQWLVATATVYDHMVTAGDEAHGCPYDRMVYRRPQPLQLPKVACRWREDLVIRQGNHGADYKGGATKLDDQVIVRHFPYRSPEQFIRKVRNGAAAYAAAGDRLPKEYGAHWRQWGCLTDEQLTDVFLTWYTRPSWSTKRIGSSESGWESVDPLVFDPVTAL